MLSAVQFADELIHPSISTIHRAVHNGVISSVTVAVWIVMFDGAKGSILLLIHVFIGVDASFGGFTILIVRMDVHFRIAGKNSRQEYNDNRGQKQFADHV